MPATAQVCNLVFHMKFDGWQFCDWQTFLVNSLFPFVDSFFCFPIDWEWDVIKFSYYEQEKKSNYWLNLANFNELQTRRDSVHSANELIDTRRRYQLQVTGENSYKLCELTMKRKTVRCSQFYSLYKVSK